MSANGNGVRPVPRIPRKVLQDNARAITPGKPTQNRTRHTAIVQSTNPLTAFIDGDNTTRVPIHAPLSYSPTIGDYVITDNLEGDHFVLGVQQVGTGGQSPGSSGGSSPPPPPSTKSVVFVTELSSSDAPNLSPLTGGVPITLTGLGFSGTTGIAVGGVAVKFSTISVLSDQALTFTAPSGNSGPQNVIVTTPFGSSPPSPDAVLIYQTSPTISSITPDEGYAIGGEVVAIAGSDFFGTYSVTFGLNASPFFWVNATGTVLSCIVPAGTAGTVTVTVGTIIGTPASTSFSYLTPSGGGTAPDVISHTSDVTFTSADFGNVHTFSGAILGATLPASPPAEPSGTLTIKNENISPLYVLSNGNTLGAVAYTTPLANSVVLYKNESIDIWSTGTSYEYRLTHVNRPVVPVGSPKWYFTGFNTQQDFGFNPQSMTAASVDGKAWVTVQNPSMVNNQTPTPFFMRDHEPIVNPVDDSLWVFFDEVRNTGTASSPSFDFTVGMQVGLAMSPDGGKTWVQQTSIDLTSVFSTLSITGNTEAVMSSQVWDGTTWWQKVVLFGTGTPGAVAFPILFGAGTCSLDTTSGHYKVNGSGGAVVASSLHVRDPSAAQWLDYFAGESSTSGVSERDTWVAGTGPFTTATTDTTHPIVQTTDSPYTTGAGAVLQGWDGSFVFYVGNGTWRAYLCTIGVLHSSQWWEMWYVETQNFTGSTTRWGTPTQCTLDGKPFFCDSGGMRPYGLVGSHYYNPQMAENLAALLSGSGNDNSSVLMAAVFGG